ncbi:Extra-large guanine nucleotide-binding protein 3 [Nymphaea thermarum]|nr:Extra-large guanine nucleotide-binding protein 3 [Nymphaea thermarum]
MKLLIQSDIYKCLGVLFEARERLEEEVFFENQTASQDHLREDEAIKSSSLYSINTRLKHFSDWLLDTISMGNFDAFFPAASREHASSLVDAWNDPAIQETYKRNDEVHALPDVAYYFPDKHNHKIQNLLLFRFSTFSIVFLLGRIIIRLAE